MPFNNPFQRDPNWQLNNAVMLAGMGLMAGRNKSEQLQGAMQGYAAGSELNVKRDERAQATKSANSSKEMVKNLIRQGKLKGISEEQVEGLGGRELFELVQIGMQPGDTPKWHSAGDGLLFNDLGETKNIGGSAGSGFFRGTSVDAQALNALIQSGQLTPEQASQWAAGKMFTNPADGSVGFQTPDGVFGRQGVGPGGQTQLTPPKTSEGDKRNDRLYTLSAKELPTAIANFDELSKNANTVGGWAYDRGWDTAGNLTTSSGYQQARASAKVIIENYLYSVSGAQAPEPEVQRKLDSIMPTPGESPQAVANKKARLQAYVEATKNGTDIDGSAGGGQADPLGIRGTR